MIQEEPAYPTSSLFADIGGSLGLYLGMSIVTIIEVAQLVTMLCLALCGSRNNPPMPSPTGKSPPPAEDTLYPRKFSVMQSGSPIPHQSWSESW